MVVFFARKLVVIFPCSMVSVFPCKLVCFLRLTQSRLTQRLCPIQVISPSRHIWAEKVKIARELGARGSAGPPTVIYRALFGPYFA